MGLIMTIASGLAGALFSLGYKYKSSLAADDAQLTMLLALFSTAASLAGIAIAGEPLVDRGSLLLGIPFGVASYLSISFYLSVIDRSQLNTSWTIIQFFVLIPFGLSIIAYGEKLDLAGAIGVALIFVSIVLFGRRRSGTGGDSKSDRRTLALLLASTLFSGISNSIPKIYTASASSTHVFTLTFWGNFWYAVCGVAALALRGKLFRRLPSRGSLMVGGWMAIMSVIGTPLLILALTRIPGAVAFPVRSIVNTVSVYFLSFALFRERLTLIEGTGAAIAITGIALVSSSVA